MNYYLILALVLFVYMSTWFVFSLIKKRNDVADIAWGLGFVLLSFVSLYLSGSVYARSALVVSLVSIWGIRLAYHIYLRNRNKTEDYRYAKWRLDWGKWFYLRSYLQVYILQGILLFLIVSPVLIINKNTSAGFGLLEIVGLLIWIIGFYFESVGDAQLAKFIKDPNNKGKLMREGLWKYTRHPNYFGEVTQWWGIWIIALSVPDGLYGLVGPLVITFLILKVSGVPLLEEKMALNPDFQDYKRKTSMFFPLPLRK